MKAMISAAFEFGRYPINLTEGEIKGKISSYQAGKKGKEIAAASDGQLKEYSELLMNQKMPEIVKKISAEVDSGTVISDVISEKLIPAMTLIGALYQAGKIFIPEMMISASTMSQVLGNFKEQLVTGSGKKQGVVVIGTVKGDLHDIGKNLVAMVLEGQGFRIVDLGVSVSSEKFLQAVEEEKADIVALSALLTTTMVEMENTIEAFKKIGTRDKVKILIGGAPVTQAFADQIGADGYAYDAPGAAMKCKELLSTSK
jgi:5-methyltetrahydrofolate--homocysteine methyltransferase